MKITRFATRFVLVTLLVSSLSGCFLTKIVTTPLRLGGAGIETVGAAVSIIPGVGNAADGTLEQANDTVDKIADAWDEVPI